MVKHIEKTRVYIYVLPDQLIEIDEMAEKTGKKRAELVNFAFIAGLEALKMAFNPNMEAYYKLLDKSFPPESSSKDG